jgi:hypothetical protein
MSEPSALNVRQGFSAAMSIGSAAMLCALACLAVAGCGFSFGGSVSDVPCLNPRTWTEGTAFFLFRTAPGAEGAILITHQTDAQTREDDTDGITGNGPHEGVYRYDPASQILELVDSSLWDSGDSRVITCLGDEGVETPLVGRDDHLEFEGHRIEVAGNHIVTPLRPAPTLPFVAVLSSDGGGGVPFLSSRSSSGQHYHEVFSDETGARLLGPVRIGLTGDASRPIGCWSEDERLIVYAQPGTDRFTSICIVDVSELLESP